MAPSKPGSYLCLWPSTCLFRFHNLPCIKLQLQSYAHISRSMVVSWTHKLLRECPKECRMFLSDRDLRVQRKCQIVFSLSARRAGPHSALPEGWSTGFCQCTVSSHHNLEILKESPSTGTHLVKWHPSSKNKWPFVGELRRSYPQTLKSRGGLLPICHPQKGHLLVSITEPRSVSI